MFYALCFQLDSFGFLKPSERINIIQHLVDALVTANVAYLRTNTNTPSIYDSGVVYRPDDSGPEKQWYDIPAALSRGYLDCKAAAAWRAAELKRRGIRAKAKVITENGFDFHVIVASSRGREDPSRRLGM